MLIMQSVRSPLRSPHLHVNHSDHDCLLDEKTTCMLISGGVSWNFVQNPEFVHWSHSMNPGYTLLTPQKLSGEILNCVYEKAQKWNTDVQQGGLGTGTCDGWEDPKKHHLQGSMVHANGVVSTEDQNNDS